MKPFKLAIKDLLPLFLLSFLANCQVGPKYHAPSQEIASEWKNKTESAPVPLVDFWWEVFNDETLSYLEKYAIGNNPELYMALERVLYARALAGVDQASLYPQVSLNPSYSNSISLQKFQMPPLPNEENIPNENDTLFRLHQTNITVPLDLSYQLDLWGAYRNQFLSAWYTAQARTEAYYVALLTLTTDLATAYFEMRSLDSQIDLFVNTIKVRRAAFEVNAARWEAGLVNYTDVSRAALEYKNAEADLYEAKRLRNIQENRIAVLIGVSSSLFCLPHAPLKGLPPAIPAGIPSRVLMQRPDIAQAEREMAAQHALIGVAYAAFFPQVTLSGTVGFSSPDLKELFSWQSRLWAIGVNVAQSILDGGRNCSYLQAAWARFRESIGNYQQRVLAAFQEVEDSLSNIENQTLQYKILEGSVEAAKTTTFLSSDRYTRGLVNYLEVVDSERAELQAEITAINVLGQSYLSTLQLIKAIGGSWNFSSEESCEDPLVSP